MQEIKKVVIIGPESTGKSTLCKQLAQHYNTLWCREYAREYLVKNGTSYTYDNLLHIAKGQVRLEDEYSERIQNSKFKIPNKLLFLDTNMYVMKVWCEFVFERCHQFIIDEIVDRSYDLYLLCNIDLPWAEDELREYPDFENREKLFHIYKDILVNQQVPWLTISGTDDERLVAAIEGVDKYFFNLPR
jgi:NadR type nicotinamide-nucleotide adenylyltransferase